MEDDFVLSTEQKLFRLAQHKQTWAQQRYDVELNAKVARALDDQNMLKQAAEQMKRVLVALEALHAEEIALQAEYEGGGDDNDQEQ